MCGRYSITDPRQLVLRFGLAVPAALEPRYNIAPTQPVPAIVAPRAAGQPGDGTPVIELLRWGLIPFWAKDQKIGNKLINARADSLASKPAFRDAARKRRCLVLADGFYEWKKEKGRKQPMYVRLKSRDPWAFAGLWDEWRAPSGEKIRSCTIVTTEPNALLTPIHDRMPAILRPEDEPRWLDLSVEAADLPALLAPYPAELMEAYPVSSYVNSPANEGPQCIAPQD
ncbi:MAG: SOS response-associated peptidase [Deltaproteobacteria bacterium]|nr:SOS response-associated peptidase [Deltaproteobacteria bacterium]